MDQLLAHRPELPHLHGNLNGADASLLVRRTGQALWTGGWSQASSHCIVCPLPNCQSLHAGRSTTVQLFSPEPPSTTEAHRLNWLPFFPTTSNTSLARTPRGIDCCVVSRSILDIPALFSCVPDLRSCLWLVLLCKLPSRYPLTRSFKLHLRYGLTATSSLIPDPRAAFT